MRICYININLYEYDHVIKPPQLPSMIDSIYITDSTQLYKKAHSLGWAKVYLITSDPHLDKFSKRKFFAKIKIYPELYVADIKNYDIIINVDSNVIKLPDNFDIFVGSLTDEYFMVVDTGYYKGINNTIGAELRRSLNNKRWEYNFEAIKTRTAEYINQLKDKGIQDVPVASAKYVVWKLKHPDGDEIRQWIFNEYQNHLQGNIIYSVAAVIYPCIKSVAVLGSAVLKKHCYRA